MKNKIIKMKNKIIKMGLGSGRGREEAAAQAQAQAQAQSQSRYVPLPPVATTQQGQGQQQRIIIFLVILLFLVVVGVCAYILWPSDPRIEVVRLRLNDINFRSERSRRSILPRIFLDVSMGLSVKVRNNNYFGVYYKSLTVGIGYRGEKIGWMKSEGSRYIPARGIAYLDVTLELYGIEVLTDVFYLLEDIARGHLPLQTLTNFNGYVHLLFLNLPLQAIVSCDIDVDTKAQSILRQNCDIGSCC